MLINKTTFGYSRNKKHITGRGFVDTMSSVFNAFKSSLAPAFRNVSSYVSTNKDLIAKPLLGAIGSLAATGLTAGVPALISHIANRSKNRSSPKIPDDPKYKEILQSLLTEPQPQPVGPPVLGVEPSVSNIIGSGTRGHARHRGAGIKTF
jgi:hypothetical protein